MKKIKILLPEMGTKMPKGARFLNCDPQRRPRRSLTNLELRNRHTGRYLYRVFLPRGENENRNGARAARLWECEEYIGCAPKARYKYRLYKYEIPPAPSVGRICPADRN